MKYQTSVHAGAGKLAEINQELAAPIVDASPVLVP